jgi:hypothetical protein
MSFIEGKDAMAGEKIIIGWLEKVYLPQYDLPLRAKIDTGAKNSSIHAIDVEYIKNGKAEGSRIRFKTRHRKGRYRIIEADVLRETRIKKSRFITRTRPEIELEICLGGIRKRIRVNLEERGGMNYRMILGRTALEGDFIVDVSKKFVAGPDCGKQ